MKINFKLLRKTFFECDDFDLSEDKSFVSAFVQRSLWLKRGYIKQVFIHKFYNGRLVVWTDSNNKV